MLNARSASSEPKKPHPSKLRVTCKQAVSNRSQSPQNPVHHSSKSSSIPAQRRWRRGPPLRSLPTNTAFCRVLAEIVRRQVLYNPLFQEIAVSPLDSAFTKKTRGARPLRPYFIVSISSFNPFQHFFDLTLRRPPRYPYSLMLSHGTLLASSPNYLSFFEEIHAHRIA